MPVLSLLLAAVYLLAIYLLLLIARRVLKATPASSDGVGHAE